MQSNLDRYKKDLNSLVARGDQLSLAIEVECHPGEAKKVLGKEVLADLPSFHESYQNWYSEAKATIRQLLPDRLSDFVAFYEKPKARKSVDYENYRIEDYLQGLRVIHSFDRSEVVGPKAAVPRFRQQLAIVKSALQRFESSLFDIRQLVQGDLFDSELDAAEELSKNRFTRAAGAVAGVVLERHLTEVCDSHKIKLSKKTPGISDLNDALKAASIVDTPQWRSIQRMADIRNLCDHDKKIEPGFEQVNDLIDGVKKVIKTIF